MKRKFQVAFEEKRQGNDFNHVRLICNDVNCTAARSRLYLIHLSNSSLTFDFFFFPNDLKERRMFEHRKNGEKNTAENIIKVTLH